MGKGERAEDGVRLDMHMPEAEKYRWKVWPNIARDSPY
jgi:hypothetical protein